MAEDEFTHYMGLDSPNRLFAFNTYQFNNYDNYKVEVFSEPEKAEYREMQFPIDCEKAFDAGKAMVQKAY